MKLASRLPRRAVVFGLVAGAVVIGMGRLVVDGRAAKVPPRLGAAPHFEVVDTYGDKVRLSDYRGRIVVLHFWATWCASCKVDLAYFQTVHERYASEGVVVLGLAYASGARESVNDFTQQLGVTFDVALCDEETRNLFEVAAFPTNYVIDGQGQIRAISRRLMDSGYWENILAGLFDERRAADALADSRLSPPPAHIAVASR
jgi:peroxiredoxin